MRKKIGGAPLNVAMRLKLLQNNVFIISSIGKDESGKKILDFLKRNNINIDGIQIDPKLETGLVKVLLDKKGSASYDIKHPVAWDQIELTDASKNIVKKSDTFIYGSLVTRNNVSKNTLYKLLKLAKYKVFDVNLRPPYYTIEVLLHLMRRANFIKFNDDELIEIVQKLGSKHQRLEKNILFIAKKTYTNSICVTLGKNGAILLYNKTFYYNKGYQVLVSDTVGAGDSFLAALINKLMKNESPQNAIDFACAVGAIVAGKEGANPEINNNDLNKLYEEN